MKTNLRWQLLLAAVCLAAVWVLLSYEPPAPPSAPAVEAIPPTPTFASDVVLCTNEMPAKGGELVEGVVGRPQYPNPLLADRNPVDRMLVDLIFDGLTRYNSDGDLVPNLAESWSVSEDGFSVTFALRDGMRWHDGQPVTTADVAYTYGLLQQDSTSSFASSDAALWSRVTIDVVDARQIRFTLADRYAPFLEATTRGILPNHILQGTSLAALANHPFNQQPVGTGPFIAQNNWQTDGVFVLLPRADYWQAESLLNAVQTRFYPDESALLDAYIRGEINAMSGLSPMAMPAILPLDNVQVYTAVLPRFTQLLFHLGPENESPIQELAVRQAMAQTVDKIGLLNSISLRGQGLPFDGPYLPNSWAYDPNNPAPYALNPISATEQLVAAGWVTADGAPEGTIRQKEDTSLTVRLLTSDSVAHTELADNLAQMMQPIGMQVVIDSQPAEAYRQRLASGEFDLAITDVSPAADPDLYDFWSQEAIVRGQNYGRWNSRRGSEALEAARQVWSADERLPYYRAFLQFYADQLPALTLYQHVANYAVSADVQRVDIGRTTAVRDRYATFNQWYLQTEDIPVPCDAAE